MADRVNALLAEALDNFDRPETSVASLVRKAVRIAALRQDFLGQYRMQQELVDLSTRSKSAAATLEPIRQNLTTLLGEEEAVRQIMSVLIKWEANRKVIGSEKIRVHSIGQIEAQLVELRRLYNEYEIPANLTSVDTYFVMKDIDGAKAKILPTISELEALIERVRQEVYDFLIETETEIHSGRATGSVFERGLGYVRTALAERAPKALEKFSAAEERLHAGTQEDLSHALTSVRRMIKELADVLYPPTDEVIVGQDKVERKMSDDAYRNRLIQFVQDRLGKTGQSKVVSDTLRSIGIRLNNLDSLASKGVHNEVAAAEAESCVVWTFMLAADLLRIDDGTALEMSEADVTRDSKP